MTQIQSRRRRSERGSVLVFVAVAMPVLILMTSFAVDLGRQRALRRDLQADADVISLDLIRLVDQTGAAPGDDVTLVALNESLQRNGMSSVSTINGAEGALVEWGEWVDATPPQSCTVTTCFTTPAASVNAVRVTFDDDVDYLFRSGSGGASRSAVASVEEEAVGAFSIGSSLARLDTGDSALLNPLMSGLLGSNVGLGVADYQGLVAANVNLLDLLDAAAGVGTVDELLASDMSMAQFIDLSADALTNRGMLAEAELLRTLPVNIPTPEDVALGDILSLPADEGSALLADMNVFDLIIAAAQVANGDNFLDLDLGIPNLASLSMQVTEPPKIAIGPAEQDENGQWITQAHAANLRIDLVVDVVGLGINLGIAGLSADVRLPISLTGGGASGYLTNVNCGPDPDELSVLTVPRPLGGSIDAVSPPLADVSALIQVLFVTLRQQVATVTADVDLPIEEPEELAHSTLEVPVGSQKSASARGLSLGSMLTVNELDVHALGILSLPLGFAGGLLAALTPVLGGVDAALDPLLQLLGVRIGDTDVAALDARCEQTGPKLVG